MTTVMKNLTKFIVYLLLLTNTNIFALSVSTNDTNYCELCKNHTLCLYPVDSVGKQCINMESRDFNLTEIQSILFEHNSYRNLLASGREIRGNPGPQQAAKNMEALLWSNDLAEVAKRWAIQCVPKKDKCRDLNSDFGVWQNIHILYINAETLEAKKTALQRIPVHIQSWTDDVENFDASEVGLIDFSRDNRGPYIGMAAGRITHVGCGRALYSLDKRDKNMTESNIQLEMLVCNYGPVNRSIPQNLYDYNISRQCPVGYIFNEQFHFLCEPRRNTWRKHKIKMSSSNMMVSSTALLFFLILGHFVINTIMIW